MNPFSSILVPLDGSLAAARSLTCATWLASRLDAQLHLLSATAQKLPARAELTRLHVPEEYWPRITLHQAEAYPQTAILAAVAQHDVQLVIMSTRGQALDAPAQEPEPSKIVGHVACAVIEQSPVPVLLLSPRCCEHLPWKRALVPISGDLAVDDALALGVRLANALDLTVYVAHVADPHGVEAGLAAAARYADASHHEYAEQLEELVSRALPHCSLEDCGRIVQIALCHGDVTAELLRLIAARQISVIVIGWHGHFMNGHAQVLKHLLQTVSCPVLLVKPAPRPPFKLKVGDEME
jgi:nucleotide-binding universal stress UspA family protein